MSAAGVGLMHALGALDGIADGDLEIWIAKAAEHGTQYDLPKVRLAIDLVRHLGIAAARLMSSETKAYEALLRARSTDAAGVELFRRVDAARARMETIGGTLTVLEDAGRTVFGVAIDDGEKILSSKSFDSIDELAAEIGELEALARADAGSRP